MDYGKNRTHDEELGWGRAFLPVNPAGESDILYMITICDWQLFVWTSAMGQLPIFKENDKNRSSMMQLLIH